MDSAGLDALSQFLANPIRLSALGAEASRSSLRKWLTGVMKDFLPAEVRLAVIAQLEPDSQNLLLQIDPVLRTEEEAPLRRAMKIVSERNAVEGASFYSTLLRRHKGPEPVVLVITKQPVGHFKLSLPNVKIAWLEAPPPQPGVPRRNWSKPPLPLPEPQGDREIAHILKAHCAAHESFLENIRLALDYGAIWLVLSRIVVPELNGPALGAAALTAIVKEEAEPSGVLLLRMLMVARAIDSFVGTAYQVTKSSVRSDTARDALGGLRHSLGNRYRRRALYFPPEIQREDHLVNLLIEGAVDLASDRPRFFDECWNRLGFDDQPLQQTLKTVIWQDDPRFTITTHDLGPRLVRCAVVPLLEELATNLMARQPAGRPAHIEVTGRDTQNIFDVHVSGFGKKLHAYDFLEKIQELEALEPGADQDLKGTRAIFRYVRALRSPLTRVRIVFASEGNEPEPVSSWRGIPFGIDTTFEYPEEAPAIMLFDFHITNLIVCGR